MVGGGGDGAPHSNCGMGGDMSGSGSGMGGGMGGMPIRPIFPGNRWLRPGDKVR